MTSTSGCLGSRTGTTLGSGSPPQEPWQGILSDPRLRSLTMEEAREEKPGFTRVEVAPSTRIPVGVYVGVNEHYAVEDAFAARYACDLLVSEWDANHSKADTISPQSVVASASAA